MQCLSCQSISGERPISPGPTIYEGKHWLVEHAYPCGMKGWLVLVLRRHAEALHELGTEEFAELGELQGRAARSLNMLLGCEKEYVACFAEAEGFHHVHFHVVARAADLPDELKATKIFSMLKPDPAQAVPPEEIARFCIEMQYEFARRLTSANK